MFRFLLKSLAACSLLLAANAFAYTPESGFWWNPAESGTGLQIEIQDNYIAVVGYSYDAEGNQIWVTTAGFLDDNASYSSSDDPNDGTWLTSVTGGQCLGCDYTGFPQVHPGAYGKISLVFDPADPTKATLTWGGRSQPIERYQFYLKRPEDSTAPIQVTKLLGEWQALMDLTDHPNISGYSFYGDVIGFESLSQNTDGVWIANGCRADDSLGAGCYEFEEGQYYHDAAALYDEQAKRQLILITDNRNSNGDPVNCVLYDVRTDTNFFSGGLDNVHDGLTGGVTLYPCSQNPFTFNFYPTRGYRSASRTFVQEGTGPSKRAAHAAPRSLSALIQPVKRDPGKAMPANAEHLREQVALLLKQISTPHSHHAK